MADTTAPLLQRTLPADNATAVSVTANLGLEFSEAVKVGSGLIKIYKSDGTLFLSIAANDTAQVTLDSTGTRVIINPSVSLLAGTSFYVIVDPGAFEDLAGNNYAGLSSPTAFNFSTAGSAPPPPAPDTAAPLLVSTTPADDSNGVAIGTNLVLTFDETVKQGSPWGKIEIHDAATGNLVQQFMVSDYVGVTFPISNQVIINPTPNLLPGKSYYVTIEAGAIVDLADNPFAGITSPTVFNFSTPPDVTAPLLQSTWPTDDLVVTAGMNSITLGFNEVVTRGAGSVKIYRAADNSLFESISIEDLSHASFSSYEPYTSGFVTLHLTNILSSGTAYYVLVDSGAIQDLSGNDYAGITSPTALNFTTRVVPDGVAPLLLNTSPTDDATNAPVDGVITLTFNEAVTVDVGEIRISQMSAPWSTIYIQSNDTSQVSISGNVVTIDPSADLDPSMQYSVVISSNVFADVTGTWFPGTTFNFATEATTTPVLLSTSPSDNAANVVVNPVLVMTFDQAVSAGSGNIEIHNANGSIFEAISITDASRVTFSGDKVVIDPSGILGLGATYYVTMAPGVIEDELGVHAFAGLTGNTGYNFTTKISADATAPLLVSASPSDGSSNVPQASSLVFNFNEFVVAGAGRIEFHTADGGLVLAGPANVLSEYLTFAGTQLTIQLGMPLELGESYYLLLDVGAVQDLAGNPFAGIPTDTGFNFTVTSVDTLYPTLIGSGPSDGYANWPIDGSPFLVFSEAIQRGTGSIGIYRSSDGSLVEEINVTDQGKVHFDNDRVSIDPSVNLDPYTDYYLLVDNGAVRDLAGNAWSGIGSPTTLNFVTGSLVSPPPPGGGSGGGAGAGGGAGGFDSIAPSLTAISPADNAAGVATTSNIVLTFNEGVQAGTGTLQIRKLSDGSVAKSIALSDAGQVQFSGATITVNPSTDLAPGTGYYVVLESGAVQDGSGNSYGGFSSPAAFNFTTVGRTSGLILTGNSLSNTLTGGAGNDTITGLGRGDTLTGAGGSDKFVYNAVADSTSKNYDTVTDFDASADLFDLWFQVTGVDTSITSGSLGTRRFDSDLASAVSAAKLAAHHAVLFTPTTGTLSGKAFLIVDANGVAGYQASADLVILLGNASSLTGLTPTDFV